MQVAIFLGNETLTASGTANGTALHRGTYQPDMITPSSRGSRAYGSWNASALCGSVDCKAELIDTGSPGSTTDPLTFNIKITASVDMSGMFPGVANSSSAVVASSIAPALVSHDFGGTYSASMDVERFALINITYRVWPNYRKTRAPISPDFAIVPPNSGPMQTGITIVDRPRIGGTASLTVTGGGVTATVSRTIDAYAQLHGTPVDWSSSIQAFANATVSNHAPDVTSTVSITGQMDAGGGPSVLTSTFLRAELTPNTATLDGRGGASASCSASSPRGVASADLGLSGVAPRKANITGGIWQMQSPSTVPVTVSINGRNDYTNVSATGAFSSAITQSKWTASGHMNLDGTTYTDSLDETSPLSCFIQPDTLTSNGRSAGQIRLPFRAFAPFKAARVSQAANFTVQTPTAANYIAGAHTTLSGTAPMQIAVAGGVGSFYRQWGTAGVGGGLIGAGPDISGYAWLRLQFDPADAGASFLVTLNKGILYAAGWTFPVTVATDGTVDIDTTDIWLSGQTFSDADSKWPLVQYDQPGFGIRTLDRIDINNMPTGHTYKLSSISMVRKHHSKLTFLEAFSGGHHRYDSETGPPAGCSETVWRAAVGDTDGRQSVEFAGVSNRSDCTSGGYFSIPLNEALAELAAVPGYTVTPQSNVTMCWTGNNPYDYNWDGTDPSGTGLYPLTCIQNNAFGVATWLSGYHRSGGAWVSTFDIDTSTPIDIMAQMTFDVLGTWPPGCGDILGMGGGGGQAIELAASAIIDGEAYGLVFDATGNRTAGVSITVKDHTGGTARGNATTDARGQYLTGSPYVPDVATQDITAATTPVSIASNYVIPPRYRRRFAFRAPTVTPSGKVIWSLRDYTGRLMVWMTATDGSLVCLAYDDHDSSPVTYTVDSASSCSWPAFHLQGVNIDGTYLRGKTAMTARSTNHARTWTMDTIPGTYLYTALTSAEQRGRLVECGYHTHDTAISGDPATGWYVHVGKLNMDGSYAWSATPVAMSLSAATGMAHLRSRPDGVLEFTYLDGTNATKIARCYQLSLAGVGTWT